MNKLRIIVKDQDGYVLLNDYFETEGHDTLVVDVVIPKPQRGYGHMSADDAMRSAEKDAFGQG